MLKSLFNVASIGKIYYNSWTKVGPVGVINIIAKDRYSAIYEKWSLLLKNTWEMRVLATGTLNYYQFII